MLGQALMVVITEMTMTFVMSRIDIFLVCC